MANPLKKMKQLRADYKQLDAKKLTTAKAYPTITKILLFLLIVLTSLS